MNKKYSILERNFKKFFVDVYKIFNEISWQELSDSSKKIEHLVKEESRQIEFIFNIKSSVKSFSKELLTSLIRHYEDSPYKKSFVIRINAWSWKIENISRIIASILEIKKIEVTFSENDESRLLVVTDNKDQYQRLVENKGLIIKAINYLFNRQVEMLVDKHYQEPEPVEESERSATPIRRRFTTGKAIEGEYCCFKIEEKLDIKKKTRKFKVGITNYKQSYWLSIINKESAEEAEKIYKLFEINSWYKCRFTLSYDDSFKTIIDGFLLSAEKVRDADPVAKDESEYGHIYGLCTHTKNSAFDGLYTAAELVNEAAARGHKVIGLADLGSLQSYSEFETLTKKARIKGIYGVELEVVPLNTPIVIGGYSDNWLNVGVRIGDKLCKGWDGETYSVLDIETTGLNPFIDEIIQISVKKYKFKGYATKEPKHSLVKEKVKKKIDFSDLDGFAPIATFDRYIKTVNKKISQKIYGLTHISQEKLDKDGLELVSVLKELKEFIKGSLVVAHNGINFDIPFINAHLRANNIGEIEETTLDTLRLSHYLFQRDKFKSHTLSALCKKAGISYDETEAHNSLYDVEVLAELLFTFLVPQLKFIDDFDFSSNLREINDYFWKKEARNRNVWGDKVLIYIKKQSAVKDLYRLVSLAHTDYYQEGVKITRDEIDKVRKDNLIVVSNPLDGEVIRAVLQNDRELFRNIADWYDYIIIPPVGHFELDIKKQHFSEDEIKGAIKELVKWVKEDGYKWFFNSSIRYINKEQDKDRYSVLVNIKGIFGKRHWLYCYRDPELRSVQPILDFKYSGDLLEEYSFLWGNDEKQKKAFIEESLKNQQKFVDSCDDNIEVVKKTLHPPKIANCGDLLKEICEKRLKEVYGEKIDEFLVNRYDQELRGLIENDFSVVYWVSYLLVKKSIEEGYLVGSRGSVGSSFIAFLMGISEVNPLPAHYFCGDCSYFELAKDWTESGFDLPPKPCPCCSKDLSFDGHDIPFETFLGFGGNKVPDIDLNFSGEYQIKAHNFLKEYFGEERVFRAGTIGSMAEKTAVSVVDEYEAELNLSLNKGAKLWLSSRIVDVKRTTGQHPGGILVVPEDKSIYDFTPINFPANDTSSDWYTTHFAFDDLHDALLKFDILGHDDPTALSLLKKQTNVDPLSIPYRDENLVKLYRSCEAMGIARGQLINDEETGALGLPEFGTALTRKIIKDCQPQTFADLMRISGFSHGIGVWKGNIEKLVKDKEKYPLNKVITCRDDIMLYLIRTGLSSEDAFNITEHIRKGRGVNKEFEDLMREKGVPDWYIESAKQITYIFPKAHATAYVMMSWKIAYYKLYHPLSFYSSYFTTSVDSFDLELLVQNNLELVGQRHSELQNQLKNSAAKSNIKAKDKAKLVVYEVAYEFLLRGFKFANVCVNKSEFDLFVPVTETKELIIPLKAVDGLGEQGARTVILGRKKGGIYRSIEDLRVRGKIKGVTTGKLKSLKIIPDGVDDEKIIFDEQGELIK